MIDILLAMAADPLGTALTSVLIFSLGMYPLGLMLGSECSPCCDPAPPCSLCTEGKLPDTVTVTFSGIPNQQRGSDRITIRFEACFGVGGLARATDPGGDADTAAGPISAIELTSPGSGYAKLARVEPEITVETSGNNDAEFTISTTQELNSCGIPTWSVSGVSVTKAGSGYTNGQLVNFLAAEGTTAEIQGSGTILTRLDEPSATLSVDGGDGASLAPVWQASSFQPEKFELASVTVSNGGSGYTDGSEVLIAVQGTTVEESPAYAVIQNKRQEPQGIVLSAGIVSNASGFALTPVLSQLTDWDGRTYWGVTSVRIDTPGEGWVTGESVIVPPGGFSESWPFFGVAVAANEEPTLTVAVSAEAGTGGEVTASLSQTTLPDGNAAWEISGIAITASGSGYVPGGTISVALTAGSEIEPLVAEVIVNETGEITAVEITNRGKFARVGVLQEVIVYDPGYYFFDTGIIESVQVYFGGTYYNDTGEVVSVLVDSPGRYYKEDPSGTPYVATVTGEILQLPPSNGNGAIIEATVDSDPESPTFGQLTGVTIANGGDGYLAWVWDNKACLGDQLNGVPITVKLQRNPQCVYSHSICIGGRGSTDGRWSWNNNVLDIRVQYKGPTQPPTVYFFGEAGVFVSDSIVTNCDEFSFVATREDGATATVSSATEYDPVFRFPYGDILPVSSRPQDRTGCDPCCQGFGISPDEIEVDVVDRGYYSTAFSGRYVLAREAWIQRIITPYGPGSRWGYFIPLNEFLSASFHISVVLAPSNCWVPASDGGCNHCHRKCQLRGIAYLDFQPRVWWNPPDVDMRDCHYYDPANAALTLWQLQQIDCQVFCTEDTPICRPPSGRTFSSFKPSGSDNFTFTGDGGSLCDPNTDRPDHLNTFTVTIV